MPVRRDSELCHDERKRPDRILPVLKQLSKAQQICRSDEVSQSRELCRKNDRGRTGIVM